MDGWVDGWIYICMYICTYVCMYVCMDGWVDGWVGAGMHGRMLKCQPPLSIGKSDLLHVECTAKSLNYEEATYYIVGLPVKPYIA